VFRAAILALLCLCFTASAEAATLHVSTTGSDSAQCSQSAPCLTFGKAYGAAVAGDTIQVAPGTYQRQDVPSGTKAVTFNGGSGVKVRQLWNQAKGLTYDGINVDGNFVRKQTGLQLSGNRVTFKNATVGNIADEKNIVNGDGHVIDNVTFHDVIMTPTGEAEGVHMECLYSQAPNITIKNSRFTNCAVMDVFFTRGTWYNQPEYGGWTLTGNHFGMPRRVNGQGSHYYSVMWAWQSKFDRAVVRGNTYEAAVAAQDMNGNAASFTNSAESCNTPAFNLNGMTKETC
jgi:hypothetical protein